MGCGSGFALIGGCIRGNREQGTGIVAAARTVPRVSIERAAATIPDPYSLGYSYSLIPIP